MYSNVRYSVQGIHLFKLDENHDIDMTKVLQLFPIQRRILGKFLSFHIMVTRIFDDTLTFCLESRQGTTTQTKRKQLQEELNDDFYFGAMLTLLDIF